MKVALFATCFNDTMWPGTPRAVVVLLERLGCEVEFPTAQTCCGQVFTNTGYAAEAVPLVRSFVDVFSSYDHVVVPSGSCTGSIRQQHRGLAERAGDPGLERAVTEVTPRVHELSEFLVDVLGVTDVGAYFPHRVTYHPTCHSLRMIRVGERPLQLLRAVRGIDLVELPAAEECCGFGGTFAMKNADVSVAMGFDKARHVKETGAEVVVAGDNSCLAHIGGLLSRERAGVQTLHLAEVLASTEEHPWTPEHSPRTQRSESNAAVHGRVRPRTPRSGESVSAPGGAEALS
ncbi:Fe-S osidoreductase [Intrasporangium chromatireducens Q5-1]|uniref:Fe-S osidoreductase n=1 Tax=Intrasporangium chromatireducens Q5-1 TaxID=584657 RepID=W9GI94_9MICO|nr:(Fe-S)-binding protein [Intrasporangium chromatireducens]EWT05966.1 Fe-S osidoreductase [Intrasporangium chromatireducens Q5-1]